MVSKLLVALCLTMAVVVAVPTGPAAPASGGFGPPPWVVGSPAWPGPPNWAGPPSWAGPPNWTGPRNWPGLPPWIAATPWYPKWNPCTTIGKSCLDCNTKMICTWMGGMEKICSDPTMPYCNLGECSATPTAECASPSVPPSQTV